MSYDAALCCGVRGDDAGKDSFQNLTNDDQGAASALEVQER